MTKSAKYPLGPQVVGLALVHTLYQTVFYELVNGLTFLDTQLVILLQLSFQLAGRISDGCKITLLLSGQQISTACSE
jgi:hypothetical protein